MRKCKKELFFSFLFYVIEHLKTKRFFNTNKIICIFCSGDIQSTQYQPSIEICRHLTIRADIFSDFVLNARRRLYAIVYILRNLFPSCIWL